jgi:hypothetical protein
MNEKQSRLLLESFDLRKLDRSCNFRGCDRHPSREILLQETNIITKERKEMASLYFCSEHYNDVSGDITVRLNEVADKRWVVGKKEYDVGFITH